MLLKIIETSVRNRSTILTAYAFRVEMRYRSYLLQVLSKSIKNAIFDFRPNRWYCQNSSTDVSLRSYLLMKYTKARVSMVGPKLALHARQQTSTHLCFSSVYRFRFEKRHSTFRTCLLDRLRPAQLQVSQTETCL